MKTLLVHNHIAKNAGSYIRKILEHEYQDRFHFARSIYDLNNIDISQDTLCLEIHHNNGHVEFLNKFYSVCSNFDEVKLFTCLRHPLSRIISGLRHGRRHNEGYSFSPYARLVRGPYDDFMYQKFKDSTDKEIKSRYATPSASTVIDFILKCSEDVPQDLEFSIGQSIQFSLNGIEKVVSINKQLRKMVNKTSFAGFNDDFNKQTLEFIGAPAYEIVGVQERIPEYVNKLISSGIISHKSASSCGNAPVNKGIESKLDFVEPSLALDFYLKFPVDFVLWGMFFEKD